jgi:hypothetical protein
VRACVVMAWRCAQLMRTRTRAQAARQMLQFLLFELAHSPMFGLSHASSAVGAYARIVNGARVTTRCARAGGGGSAASGASAAASEGATSNTSSSSSSGGAGGGSGLRSALTEVHGMSTSDAARDAIMTSYFKARAAECACVRALTMSPRRTQAVQAFAVLVPDAFWPSVLLERDGDDTYVEVYERAYALQRLVPRVASVPGAPTPPATDEMRMRPAAADVALRATVRALACATRAVTTADLLTLATALAPLLDAPVAADVSCEARRLALIALRVATLAALANSAAGAAAANAASAAAAASMSSSTLPPALLASKHATLSSSLASSSPSAPDDGSAKRERRGRARSVAPSVP